MNKKIIKKEIDQDFTQIKRGKIYRYIINDVEKILIERSLEQAFGNQILAAKILGINRNTIRSKIKQLHIKVGQFKL